MTFIFQQLQSQTIVEWLENETKLETLLIAFRQLTAYSMGSSGKRLWHYMKIWGNILNQHKELFKSIQIIGMWKGVGMFTTYTQISFTGDCMCITTQTNLLSLYHNERIVEI